MPPVEKCVHVTRNNRFVKLNALPVPQQGQAPPPTYAAETSRVATEIAKVKAQVKNDEEQERALNALGDASRGKDLQYDRIQSEYANFNQYKEDVKNVKNVSDSLKPLRPPTAPSSDLEIERRKIIEAQQPQFFFIQLVLALLVTALISYVILPEEYAHAVSFLLLSVAISFGFFLRR